MKKILLPIMVFALGFTSCDNSDEVTKTTYALDEEHSVVEWKGYSPVLYHDGSFAVESAGIEVVDGKVKGGTFTIPIASIKNFDLPDDVKPVLLNHLKSPDFFNLAVYPNATFKITKVQEVEAGHMVSGDFTMLGKTHAISFPAEIALEKGRVKVEAEFKLDRTKWGMNYAADPSLGDHHILPDVDIYLNVVGNKL